MSLPTVDQRSEAYSVMKGRVTALHGKCWRFRSNGKAFSRSSSLVQIGTVQMADCATEIAALSLVLSNRAAESYAEGLDLSEPKIEMLRLTLLEYFGSAGVYGACMELGRDAGIALAQFLLYVFWEGEPPHDLKSSAIGDEGLGLYFAGQQKMAEFNLREAVFKSAALRASNTLRFIGASQDSAEARTDGLATPYLEVAEFAIEALRKAFQSSPPQARGCGTAAAAILVGLGSLAAL